MVHLVTWDGSPIPNLPHTWGSKYMKTEIVNCMLINLSLSDLQWKHTAPWERIVFIEKHPGGDGGGGGGNIYILVLWKTFSVSTWKITRLVQWSKALWVCERYHWGGMRGPRWVIWWVYCPTEWLSADRGCPVAQWTDLINDLDFIYVWIA